MYLINYSKKGINYKFEVLQDYIKLTKIALINIFNDLKVNVSTVEINSFNFEKDILKYLKGEIIFNEFLK